MVARLLLAGLLLAPLVAGCTGDQASVEPPDPCLGAVERCSQPLREVGLLGSQQAAASGADPAGQWAAPWTNLTVGQQLDRGVRALALEVRSAIPHAAGVQTDPAGPPAAVPPAELRDELIARTAAIAGSRATGPAAAYLCAGPCELGAVALVDFFRAVDAWLVEQPRELLILAVDDYSVGDQFAAALRTSLLDRRVITGEATPTTTVGDLLQQGQVLLLDSGTAAGSPLLRRDWLDSTGPLSASGSGACSVAGEGLLLVRQYRGDGPDQSAALVDNEQSAIAGRLSSCRADSGRLPGVLLLSFPELGDGLRALRQVDAGG